MFYYSVTLLEVIDYCGWSEASSNLYSLPGEASFVRTTLHNEVCVHCGEYDRAAAAAAASALGIVHLYMTGAHAAFEHPASPLPPPGCCTLTHAFQEKVPTTWCLSRTHLPAIIPTRFPRTRYLVRTCKAFPLQGSEVSQCFLLLLLLPFSFALARLASGNRREEEEGETLERERERARVLEGKVWSRRSLVGDGEKRGRKGGRKGGGGAGLCLQGCVMRPGRFQPPAASDTVTPPPKNKTNLVQDGRLFKSDRFYRWIVRLIVCFFSSNPTPPKKSENNEEESLEKFKRLQIHHYKDQTFKTREINMLVLSLRLQPMINFIIESPRT